MSKCHVWWNESLNGLRGSTYPAVIWNVMWEAMTARESVTTQRNWRTNSFLQNVS